MQLVPGRSKWYYKTAGVKAINKTSCQTRSSLPTKPVGCSFGWTSACATTQRKWFRHRWFVRLFKVHNSWSCADGSDLGNLVDCSSLGGGIYLCKCSVWFLSDHEPFKRWKVRKRPLFPGSNEDAICQMSLFECGDLWCSAYLVHLADYLTSPLQYAVTDRLLTDVNSVVIGSSWV